MDFINFSNGARCSYIVKAFAHGAMGHRIDPSHGTHFSFNDWYNKGHGMCYPVVGLCI